MLESLNKLPRWLLFELAIPLTILNIWLLFRAFQSFQNLITIFVIANVLAFILDFPVQYLQQRGLKRGYAILAIAFLALIGVVIFGLAIAPTLLQQLHELVERLPSWIESADQQIQTLENSKLVDNLPVDLSQIMSRLTNLISGELQTLPSQILDLVLEVTDSVVEGLLIVVFTLYLLLHGEEFWQGLFRWLPKDLGMEIQQALRLQFKNYFIGQATIAALMGTTLTIAFFLLNVPFWLLFGSGIGIAVLIPFGDTLSIVLVSALVSLKSFGLGVEVLLVAFVIDQVIDNAVTPRLLGELIGLNPVWILLALLVGAQVAGLLGILVAVPIAGSINRIVKDWQASQANLSTELSP